MFLFQTDKITQRKRKDHKSKNRLKSYRLKQNNFHKKHYEVKSFGFHHLPSTT